MGIFPEKAERTKFCERRENDTVYCESRVGDKKVASVEMEQKPELGGELRTLNVHGNEKEVEELKRYAQANVSVSVAVKKSRGET